MTRGIRIIFLAAVLAAVACGTASAEKTFPVNDNNTGLFDQPSAAQYGAVTHVAFIGDNTGTGAYKVYYAAINGSADFTNVNLVRDNTVILTPATLIDNAAPVYADARHPKIAVRSATSSETTLVILFQAKPTSTSDTAYRPFIARVTVANNAVVSISVNEINGVTAGDVEDISFALLTTDNTARIVYGNRSAIGASEPFQLFFARVGLDNATATTPVAVTASYPLSLGFRPIPSLALDDLNREHIAWAATDNSGTNEGPVYYAMIKETNGIDNMVIAPTAVMTRSKMRWSFPAALVFNHSLITVLAADEVSGNLGYVQINPVNARQNGGPLWDNVSVYNQVLLVPPGEVILPDNFSLFRPEAFYESLSGRIFLTGYGTSGATFFSIKLNTAVASADFVTFPTQFSTTEPPSGIDNDYTKAAFGFPGAKVVVFWSGSVGTGNRNLDVTTVPTVAAWISSQEKGCSVAAGHSGVPGASAVRALMLLLPAVVLCARRRYVRPPGAARREGLES